MTNLMDTDIPAFLRRTPPRAKETEMDKSSTIRPVPEPTQNQAATPAKPAPTPAASPEADDATIRVTLDLQYPVGKTATSLFDTMERAKEVLAFARKQGAKASGDLVMGRKKFEL